MCVVRVPNLPVILSDYFFVVKLITKTDFPKPSVIASHYIKIDYYIYLHSLTRIKRGFYRITLNIEFTPFSPISVITSTTVIFLNEFDIR